LSPHPLFDPLWYSAHVGARALRGMSPIEHYLETGGREGDPHPLFSTRWYLAQTRETELQNTTPLHHYLTTGAAEGLDPHPLFNTGVLLGSESCRGGIRCGSARALHRRWHQPLFTTPGIRPPILCCAERRDRKAVR
jgi:hypothetical protein